MLAPQEPSQEEAQEGLAHQEVVLLELLPPQQHQGLLEQEAAQEGMVEVGMGEEVPAALWALTPRPATTSLTGGVHFRCLTTKLVASLYGGKKRTGLRDNNRLRMTTAELARD